MLCWVGEIGPMRGEEVRKDAEICVDLRRIETNAG